MKKVIDPVNYAKNAAAKEPYVSKSIRNKGKLFAIWKYDEFPYFLGGEVIELREDDYCTVEGYDGMKFQYMKLYPLEEGKRLYKEVKEKSQKFATEVYNMNRKVLGEINNLMRI